MQCTAFILPGPRAAFWGGLQHDLGIWCRLDCQTLAHTSIPGERARPQRCCAEQGPAGRPSTGMSRRSPNRPTLAPGACALALLKSLYNCKPGLRYEARATRLGGVTCGGELFGCGNQHLQVQRLFLMPGYRCSGSLRSVCRGHGLPPGAQAGFVSSIRINPQGRDSPTFPVCPARRSPYSSFYEDEKGEEFPSPRRRSAGTGDLALSHPPVA